MAQSRALKMAKPNLPVKNKGVTKQKPKLPDACCTVSVKGGKSYG